MNNNSYNGNLFSCMRIKGMKCHVFSYMGHVVMLVH